MPGLRSLRVSFFALLTLAWLCPGPAASQEVEGPLGPAGRLRIGVAPAFWTADSRFGYRTEDGRVVEEVEPLAFDLVADPLGTGHFPGFTGVEAALTEATDDPGFGVRLGRSRARIRRTVLTVPFRVDLGVTDWLTVGATVPLVQRRSDVTFLLAADSTTANVGLNPALDDPVSATDFLQALSDAVAEMASRVDELCTVDPGGPDCLAAEEALADGDAFADALGLAFAGAVFPFPESPAGRALQDRLDTLRTRFEGHGVASVPATAALPLAEGPLSDEGFDRLVGDPGLGVGGAPIEPWRSRWELGDVELHAALRLLQGVSTDTTGAFGGIRYLVGVSGLVRLGTGHPDDLDHFVDLGSGDGQTDVEVRAFADVALGGSANGPGLWTDVRYGRQLEGTRGRRIAPPEVVFAPLETRRALTWDPGDYLEAEVAPRWRLTPELAVALRYRFRSKGADRYRLGGPGSDESTGALPWDPSVLELETEETVHEVGVSLGYSTLRAHRAGLAGRPIEASLAYRRAVAGSGGLTPKAGRVEAGLRLFWRLWGE